jgi:predicted site-specific integrase-resolvase
MSAAEVCERLGITLNNLRQIQHRKTLTWVQKSGRNVFYTREDVENYFSKRQELNQG